MGAALSKLLLLALPLGIGLVSSAKRKRTGQTPAPAPPGGAPSSPGSLPGSSGVPAGHTPKSPAPTPSKPSKPLEPGGVIAALDEYDFAERDRLLHQAVVAGLYEFPDVWSVESLGSGPMEGWKLLIPVMTDALQIEGVRVTTSFRTAQAIADAIGGFMMLTPFVCGLIYEQAHAQLTPTTSAELTVKTPTARTSQMIEASQRVDQKLAPIKAQRDAKQLVTLVANPSKDWVLTRWYLSSGRHSKTNVAHAESGANHGLYTAPWDPIQNVGLAHPMSHVDYSQGVRFMGTHSSLFDPHGHVTLVSNAEIIRDPEMAHMLTGVKGRAYGKQVGEGPLPFARHPQLAQGIVV